MGLGIAGAILGGAVIGGIGSFLGGSEAASGAEAAAGATLQGTRESIAAQERMFAESMRLSEQARQDSLAGWYAQQYYTQPQRQAQYWGMEGLMRELYGSDFNAQFPSYEAQHLSAFYDPASQPAPSSPAPAPAPQPSTTPTGWTPVGALGNQASPYYGSEYQVPQMYGISPELARQAWAYSSPTWEIDTTGEDSGATEQADYDRFRREFGAAAGQEYDPYRYRSEATKYAEGLEGYGAVTNRGILFDPGTDLSGAPTPSMPRAIDDMDQYRATATGREGVTSSPVSAYDRTGTRGTRDIDRGGITSYYEPQAMPEYQNAPPLNMQGSPLYQWQREQGEEAINRQLSARGLLTSGAGMGTLADYYRAMDANEAMRIQNLMRTMAGFSAPTPSFSGNYNPASLAMQAGGQMGSTYQTGGVNQANALLQAGQARSGMWTNLANVGMAGMNAYSQYQGLNNFYGGGGTNLNQLAPAISY